jgi:CHAT domain-containing protein
VRGYALPGADSLKAPIARFAAAIQNGSSSGDLARALGDALLRPALTQLDAAVRRLIIIPDGPVHRVAFDALRLPDGRYVAQRYAVSLAPSAGVLAALWRRPRGAGDRSMRLLAFGDPAFAPGADTTEGFQRLRSSGREARLAASYSPASVVRVREDASEAFLKHARLDPFRVLHFATHTLVDEQTAARTALVLAPGGGESGLVGPGELAALDLDADLVVLSSCRSAGGAIVRGEGVQGLTAPLFQAGARSVVATQWEVGDRSTVRLMESLYRNLAGGARVGDALHRAKLESLHRGASPREWAAFVTVGDPLVEVPLHTPTRSGHWAVIVLIGVALGVPLSLYLRRYGRPRQDHSTKMR